MRIVLADAPNSVCRYAPNLGLLYLASYLRKVLPKTEILYLGPARRFKDHVKAIEEFSPALYGISFTSYDVSSAFTTIRQLKDIYPWLKVICGGPHSTAVPREVLNQTGADVCVIGEGEVTFADLVKNESEFPEVLATIPGIAYMRNGEYIQNKGRPFVKSIDEIPFPARDLVSDKGFVGLPLYHSKPTAEMVVSRGCPYRCVFCSNPVFRTGNPALRMRSPKAIAQEAEILYKMSYREIYLHSDELNCNHDWAVEVCEAIADLGHSDLLFQCNMRADKISGDLSRSLRRMNCWLVRLGIESANQRVLDGIKKKISVNQISDACSLLSENGIKVFGFFMMFQIWEANGQLEYETPEEVSNSLNFAENLRKTNNLHYISWAIATPMHGSEMYDILNRHGFINSNYYPCDQWDVSKYLPHISKKQFSNLLRRGMGLQAKMAIKSGSIGWKNWRRILFKVVRIIKG